MNEGDCFIFRDHSTIYKINPNQGITCKEGAYLPHKENYSFNKLFIHGGKVYESEKFNTRSDYSDYIMHVWQNTDNYFFDYNFLILPAVICVIAVCNFIMNLHRRLWL